MAIKTASRVGSRFKKDSLKNLRIALAQVNPTLGDLEANTHKIISEIHRAKEKHCDLIVFPEAALFGYHPFDLLERKSSVTAQLKNLKKIQSELPEGLTAFVGCFTVNEKKLGRPFYNSVALMTKGKPIKYFHKTLLPTGDVFDEARFIQSGDVTKNKIKIKGTNILITICEDIWAWPDKNGKSQYLENPLKKIKPTEVDLVLNLSASPYYLAKFNERKYVVEQTAKYFKAPMVYLNMVGAQDEIIFDGGSFVVDEKGKLIAQNLFFEEDLNVIDLGKKEGGTRPKLNDATESLRQALVLGIRDYCKKTGIQRVHLGLSGGIDSAVVAALAVEALGPSHVSGIGLPGPYNAEESITLAELLAKSLRIKFIAAPISPAFELLKRQVSELFNINDPFHLALENLQARLRGVILMTYSNTKNSMLLSTSNKSEMATGYSTLYGDMCGGLAPIADLTKQQVYALAQLYNKEFELIPERIISRPPTAELKPNQLDQDSLPPYDELDELVVKLVELAKPVKTDSEAWLLKKIVSNEFKRWQAPPVLKVSKHAFGRGRRWPIAHKILY